MELAMVNSMKEWAELLKTYLIGIGD